MRLSDFIQIIECQLNVKNINSTLRFKEDLGADSLDMVELLATIEDVEGIEIPDSYEAENSVTVSDLFITIMRVVNFSKETELQQSLLS